MTPAKTRTVFLGAGLVMIAGLIALLGSGFGTDPHAIRSTMIQKEAPGFSLVDLNGQTVSLESLRGTPVVLNFWSTWCGPCKAEHPLFQGAARQHPGVQFLGVVYSDETEKVRRYVGSQGSEYPNLIDPGSRTAIDYGVTGVPETYFIDRSGTILHKEAGPVNGPMLQAWLRVLGRP